eukprot:TRINITY_DN639_c0_g1_i1.p1 TRINITY_DN639_c0_g1~~TRINITY_DN639_c0_g1_i1.p1  ORF type:complete len:512 (+),score=201.09 TRINITY_DN639_c0_g1_i1:155-1537(+)
MADLLYEDENENKDKEISDNDETNDEIDDDDLDENDDDRQNVFSDDDESEKADKNIGNKYEYDFDLGDPNEEIDINNIPDFLPDDEGDPFRIEYDEENDDEDEMDDQDNVEITDDLFYDEDDDVPDEKEANFLPGDDEFVDDDEDNSVDNKDFENKVDPFEETPHMAYLRAMDEIISGLENKSLETRSWELMGEVDKNNRPEDGLLDVDIEIQYGKRAAPVIDEAFTAQLEKIIIDRISEGEFDDPKPFVEQKIRKSRFELDNTKDNRSLADLEAQDRIDAEMLATGAIDKDTQKLHHDVNETWIQVARSLDALTNFSYTPSAAEVLPAEIVINKSMASIEMEEQVPLAFSTSNAVAPQELHKSRGTAPKAKKELTSQEKKAKRNKNKKSRMNRDSKDGKKLKKESVIDVIDRKQRKEQNNQKIKNKSDVDGQKYSNSSAFFKHLSTIKNKQSSSTVQNY